MELVLSQDYGKKNAERAICSNLRLLAVIKTGAFKSFYLLLLSSIWKETSSVSRNFR